MKALDLLERYVSTDTNSSQEAPVVLYLLGDILDGFNSTHTEDQMVIAEVIVIIQ